MASSARKTKSKAKKAPKPRQQTYKTSVIEDIFFSRWEAAQRKLPDAIVTLDQIADAIEEYNKNNPQRKKPVSTKNPANFFKDIVRRLANANKVWPASVFATGFTGSQLTGEGRCFEFIPIPPGTTQPFEPITYSANAKRIPVSTLSIPTLARQLSREDETWLIQVASRLNLIETHLATASDDKLKYVELLQIGVKQTLAEIDALYMGYGQDECNLIITVEAKTSDDIYIGQIAAQVAAVREMRSLVQSEMTIDRIIPMAIKAIGRSQVFVVQFNSVKMVESSPPRLCVVAETIMELQPPLPNL